MMQEKTRKAIIIKEIETYRKIAVAFESLKAVVQNFDGKIFNKKFVEAMDDFLKYGKENRIYHVNAAITKTSYGKFLDISIRCYDDAVKGEQDEYGHSGLYRINNCDCFLRMDVKETTTITDSGKYRINASGIITQFDQKIRNLNDEADELESSLKDVESMRADLKQIKQLMCAFNNRYQCRIKEVFNCNYELRECSGTQYR